MKTSFLQLWKKQKNWSCFLMTFLFIAIFNLLFMKLRGGILNLDLSYNSLVHYAALTPWVSAFLSIPDAEFDILNILIKLIFGACIITSGRRAASAGPAVIAFSVLGTQQQLSTELGKVQGRSTGCGWELPCSTHSNSTTAD